MNAFPPLDDLPALTLHIETRYHARHRTQLSALVVLARNVEAERGAAPLTLATMLQTLAGEMEVHMKKEELILFPAIRRGGGRALATPIAVMRADHDDHDEHVARIRALTDDLTLPEGATEARRALYLALAEFIADLDEHIRLENDVLFPPFEHMP
jgi:regulator of cell morphogenesis and NO signaling